MLIQIDKLSFFQSFGVFTLVVTIGCDMKCVLAVSKHVNMKMNQYFVDGAYFKAFTMQLMLRAKLKYQQGTNSFIFN